MKQLLFTLILFLSAINILQAQETNHIEETTWNVIRERLFSGENSKAYRFEDDIRFQLKGEATREDSIVLQNIISELKDLIEIVDVKLVNEDGNFVFTIYPPENGIISGQKVNFTINSITKVEIELNSKLISGENEKSKFLIYHSFFYLTKTFEPGIGRTGYSGIFDSKDFQQSGAIKEIDKDLIRKLYSKDFYKQLKKNTVKKSGYQFYLNLRYKNLVKNISLSIQIALIIFGFLYFLSNEPKRIKNPTLWVFIKQRIIILLIIPFIFLIKHRSGDFSPFSISSSVFYMAYFLADAFHAFLVLVIIYFSEPFFLKKIKGFVGKQSFVFFSTIVTITFIPIPFLLVVALFTDSTKIPQLFSTSTWLTNTSGSFLTLFIATLRIFYNFINYRIQSMVNQKDVELAKMKELKNQAELNALHSRINPHFLYNSLNSIAELAHINPDKTENMAVALSELFRYSINKENKTFVTVEEELEMVKKYLEIEKTRFAEKLNYTITVDETAKEKLIPKFLIQPLAENAVKHGLSKNTETGKISIEVKQLENDLVIAIFDNGPDFPDEPVSGYGLQNLYDKLEILYGKQATIYWENGNNKHFRIIIKNQF